MKLNKPLVVTIAMDSFKGSLSAKKAGEAICSGIKKACPETITFNVPISDGGEGLLTSLEDLLKDKGFERRTAEFTGAYGEKNKASFLCSQDAAILEMAEVCGLYKYDKNKLNVLNTTTYGLGELIAYLLDRGIYKITMGLGGSATCDGGVGLAQALGAKFYDCNNNLIKVPILSRDLPSIAYINIDELNPKLKNLQLSCCCDVKNPMTGKNGATYVFARQKGADEHGLAFLEQGMKNYVNVLNEIFKEDLSLKDGAGAAGALGGGLLYFLKAKMRLGIENVLDSLDFDSYIKKSDFLIVGEGKTDAQTANGKAPSGAALRAQKYGVPAIAISGGFDKSANELSNYNIKALFSICHYPMSLDEAMKNAYDLLEESAFNAMKAIVLLR